jgi:hypothetical protein
MALQSILFSADPWTIMRQYVRHECPAVARDEALALLDQAQDYYRAASSADIAAAKPVLLYYCFLNAVKAFLLQRGRRSTYEKAQHGLSEQLGPGGRELLDAFVQAHPSKAATATKSEVVNVFDDLLSELRGTGLGSRRDLQIVNLMPQIVTGHRLWVAASGQEERFISIEEIRVAQKKSTRELWSNLIFRRSDLSRLYCTVDRCVTEGSLSPTWRQVSTPPSVNDRTHLLLEQGITFSYGQHPSQELNKVAAAVRPIVWATVLSMPPYRRYYIYLSPAAEAADRLPQMLSMYALIFYLGSITRYRPHHFDSVVLTPYGGFIQSLLQELPKQFLYLLASEFARQEVTQPALA